MKNRFKSFLFIGLLTIGISAFADEPTDSPYVRAGDMVYISAQVAVDPNTGKIVSDDLTDQVNQIFKNMKATAEQAGGSMKDIVKLTVYMKDFAAAFPIVKATIPQYFTKPYPARTPVGGVTLNEGRLLEIDAVMYLPNKNK